MSYEYNMELLVGKWQMPNLPDQIKATLGAGIDIMKKKKTLPKLMNFINKKSCDESCENSFW